MAIGFISRVNFGRIGNLPPYVIFIPMLIYMLSYAFFRLTSWSIRRSVKPRNKYKK